jgi:hypothetical protein
VRSTVKAALVGVALAVPAHAVLASPADGVFKGQYVCGAGPGGMTLAITSDGGDALHAVLAFYSLPHRNNIPRGSYELKGRYVPTGRRVALNFTDWVRQPPGYAPANLRVSLTNDGRRLAGRLTRTGDCSTVTLERRR